MALPIKKFDIVIGAFILYSAEKNFFDADEIELLLGVTVDVSFALENFEKEALRKKAEADVIESEARYYPLAESCPVGIFRTDAKGNTTYVNPRWCIISGLSFQLAMGNGWLTAVHKDDREMLTNN
jgi:PAS domain-containing protein